MQSRIFFSLFYCLAINNCELNPFINEISFERKGKNSINFDRKFGNKNLEAECSLVILTVARLLILNLLERMPTSLQKNFPKQDGTITIISICGSISIIRCYYTRQLSGEYLANYSIHSGNGKFDLTSCNKVFHLFVYRLLFQKCT